MNDEIRMNRNLKIPEQIWDRFEKGEVNLIDNLWSELGEMIRLTNEMNISIAKVQIKKDILYMIDKIDMPDLDMPNLIEHKKLWIQDLKKSIEELK